MGVDIRLTLPANVRVRDAANVVSKLVGYESTVTGDSGDEAIRFSDGDVHVDGMLDNVTMARLRWEGGTMYWFFEGEDGQRRVKAESTPLYCAIAKRLVDFFGGKVEYHDTDDRSYYAAPANHRVMNSPDYGVAWSAFIRRIHDVRPLTVDEVMGFNNVAAYETTVFSHDGIIMEEEA